MENTDTTTKAIAKLTELGFTRKGAEFVHPDGRRGLLCVAHDDSRAWLQFPGRKPTMDDLRNRRSTAPAPLGLV